MKVVYSEEEFEDMDEESLLKLKAKRTDIVAARRAQVRYVLYDYKGIVYIYIWLQGYMITHTNISSEFMLSFLSLQLHDYNKGIYGIYIWGKVA